MCYGTNCIYEIDGLCKRPKTRTDCALNGDEIAEMRWKANGHFDMRIHNQPVLAEDEFIRDFEVVYDEDSGGWHLAKKI